MEAGREDGFFGQFRERRRERERRFGGWFALDNLEDAQVTTRAQLPDRLGFPLFVGFIWFWCSWMSFGVWTFVLGKVFLEGEVGVDAPPWPLAMYLGIPVAAAFGGLVTFVMVRGIRIPWRRK